MGVSLVAWVVLAALPPPPTDDGAACQQWAVDEAQALLDVPQPLASGLDGVSAGGLSEIPEEVWATLGTLGYPKADDAGSLPWRPVKEGVAPVSSVPIIDRTLSSSEEPLRRVLRASLGPANVLSDAWQVWCTLDCPGHPAIDRARFDVPMLGLALGWRGLERGQTEDAVLSCMGLAGFLRALAGSGLIGQMLSASYARGLSLLCLATARALPVTRRRALAESADLVEREWPPFSHTLRQELVFSQMNGLERLPTQLRARVPARWLPMARNVRLDTEESTWLDSVRGALFGHWAMRERCLTLAGLVHVADAPALSADPQLRAAAAPTTLGVLAWKDGPASNWIGFARRVRRLRTELRMLALGLQASTGQPLCPEVDARTGRPLELRGSGADRVVVAVADQAFEAEELRLPVPQGRPTSP